jgi:hypothetical protein
MVKLTPGEFERVLDIVRRSPDHFPSGTLAALKSHGSIPSDSVSTDHSPRQSSKPENGKECGGMRGPNNCPSDRPRERAGAALVSDV